MSKTTIKKQKVLLKVVEAYTRDVGRAIARIDYATMNALDLSTGDVVEILGKQNTVAKCLPLYPSDEAKKLFRIDGLGRGNAGIEIGDTVYIKKINALAAQSVTVKALEEIPPIDERYLADALESVPLVRGDKIMVPYFGGRLTYQVEKTEPEAAAVVVTRSTVFKINENPIKKTKPVTKDFFSDIEEMFDDDYESFKKCLDDKKLFNELVGELLIRTQGASSPSTAAKFVECMGELSRQ